MSRGRVKMPSPASAKADAPVTVPPPAPAAPVGAASASRSGRASGGMPKASGLASTARGSAGPVVDRGAEAASPQEGKGKFAKPQKLEKSEKSVKAEKSAKPRKALVRDSFTMPDADFTLIAALKERALGAGRPAKKSELLRAGLQALAALDAKKLRAALERLEPVKVGRPKQD